MEEWYQGKAFNQAQARGIGYINKNRAFRLRERMVPPHSEKYLLLRALVKTDVDKLDKSRKEFSTR